MKTKLIKLSDIHYIVVDDSEKGKSGYNYNYALRKIDKLTHDYEVSSSEYNFCKKITHSTEPLSKECKRCTGYCEQCIEDVKPIELSEVEEAIYGYSVEKIAESKYPQQEHISDLTPYQSLKRVGYIEGFKAHKELTKDKILVDVEDIRKAILQARIRENGSPRYSFDEIIQSLLPKTEWDVEFVEGKIKLI